METGFVERSWILESTEMKKVKSYSRFKTPTFDDIGPCQSRKNRNETKATIIISVKMRRSNRHELLVPILNRKKQKVPD